MKLHRDIGVSQRYRRGRHAPAATSVEAWAVADREKDRSMGRVRCSTKPMSAESGRTCRTLKRSGCIRTVVRAGGPCKCTAQLLGDLEGHSLTRPQTRSAMPTRDPRAPFKDTLHDFVADNAEPDAVVDITDDASAYCRFVLPNLVQHRAPSNTRISEYAGPPMMSHHQRALRCFWSMLKRRPLQGHVPGQLQPERIVQRYVTEFAGKLPEAVRESGPTRYCADAVIPSPVSSVATSSTATSSPTTGFPPARGRSGSTLAVNSARASSLGVVAPDETYIKVRGRA